MLELKKYQKKAIAQFEKYLMESRRFGMVNGHQIAFIYLTEVPYKERGLPGIPNVCIKIPTGGGKTLAACHMLHSLYEKFAQEKNEKGLVMWLVPTDAIRTQIITALKNREHPYRDSLDHFFSNNVKILEFKEALYIKKSDLEDNICILVATYSAFRITDKEGRKAFADNGNLIEHFQNITDSSLIKDDDGNVKYSLMNLIKLLHPIIIVDESHHTKTNLSFDMLRDMNPTFILEYTATPKEESNILVK